MTEERFNAERVSGSEDQTKTLFEDNPGVGFTYEEARDAFQERFRYLPKNLDHRMRQLRTDGFLWSDLNEKKEPVFYLKLDLAGAK